MFCGHRYARFKIIVLVFALFLILSSCSSGSAGGAGKQQASGTPVGDVGLQQAVSAVSESARQQDTPAAEDAVKVIPATVTSVVDGDTMHVKINGREEKVRLIGVNTPEIAHPDLGIKEQPYSKEAAAYTQKRLAGSGTGRKTG